MGEPILPDVIRPREHETAADILCPACNHYGSSVTDTRPSGGEAIRRRRECENCSHRWSTWENNDNPKKRRKLLRQLAKAVLMIRPVLEAAMAEIAAAERDDDPHDEKDHRRT